MKFYPAPFASQQDENSEDYSKEEIDDFFTGKII